MKGKSEMTPLTDTTASFLNSPGRRSAFLENVVGTCPEGIIANDNEGNIFLFNASAQRIFGYAPEEAIGKISASQLYPPGGAREVKEYLYSEEYGGRGHLVDFETEIVRKDGTRVPIRLCCAVLKENTHEIGMIGFFTDISGRRALQERFLESEERFRGIFESARDAIISVGESGKVVMANRAAQELLGYGEENLSGMEAIRLFPPRFAAYWKELSVYTSGLGPGNERRNIEILILSKSGAEIPVQLTLAEKIVRGQKIRTAILRDISDRKALEEELRLQSITDPLTRLYNRRHFLALAAKEVERSCRNRIPFSVLMVDVDHFKQYNDAFGHLEGDKVLVALGEQIRMNFRTMDTGFRYGGEEFLVLLPETSSAGAMVPAERLRIRFSEVAFRPHPDEQPRRVTLSIGIAEFRSGISVDDLVRAADQAMYAAKNAGRDRTVDHEHLVARSEGR
ncbi:MAG: sensor domain-containing diguanylate cyclase [Desulfobacteria bacterium]